MAGSYGIVSQEQTTIRDDAGNYVPAMRVVFRTAGSNVTGTVEIPLSMYGAQAVADAIDAYVAKINAVHEL